MLKKPLIVLAVTIFFSWQIGGAQEAKVSKNPESEIIVMFKQGVVSPPQKAARGKVEDFQFSSSNLQQTLTNAGVDTVGKLIPQFKAADTLAITRTGESVKLTDWSQVYLLQLKNAQQRKQLIDLLNKSATVIYAEPNGKIIPLLIPNDEYF